MQHRITTIDWVMLALALVSVGMLVYESVADLTPEQQRQIILADYVIIAIFAIEFALRWVKDPQPRTFVWRNWYDLLGMIPVAHPAIRGFRLFRIVRIVVLLSRFARAADRAVGQEFVFQMAGKFKGALVDAISGAVTLRVLEETEEVLLKGRYTLNLADAIEERGDEMLQIAVEKVKADPEVGRIRHMPFFEDVVSTAARVSQRIAIDLLRDERMEAIVRDIIAHNTAQIKQAIRAKDAAQQTAMAR